MIKEEDYLEFKSMMGLAGSHAAWLTDYLSRNGKWENEDLHGVHTISPSAFREYLTEHGKAASETQLMHCAKEIAALRG